MSAVLKDNELEYLVSVWASEESVLHEIFLESKQRGIEINRVKDILLRFLKLKEIGIYENTPDGSTTDYSENKSIEVISILESHKSWSDPSIFLTEKGWERYDNDTWGISVKRAREILFHSQSKPVIRIPSSR